MQLLNVSSYIFDSAIIFTFPSGMGQEATSIEDTLKEIKAPSFAYTTQTIENKFNNLVATWESDVTFLSSAAQMALHPAYQEIIGMGKDALPFILKSLENKENHWFWALRSISGVDPVDSANRGNITEMTRTWISWGKKNGYL